ncbi:MAG: class II fructose-bisphosphate aldolase, partial [Lachnospiraceae bacterium]|nr:class II fructose-bisphosphate aldolase [Lachnospiraceae bacterium]
NGVMDPNDNAEKVYTDPNQANHFVTETGITALACSFGTTHGLYTAAPRLNFDIVREVRRLTGGIPVVMHGGSGVSVEDYRTAIAAGVRKINYFTYMDKAGGAAVVDHLNSLKEGEPVFFSSIFMAAREAMKENVRSAMKVFAGIE